MWLAAASKYLTLEQFLHVVDVFTSNCKFQVITGVSGSALTILVLVVVASVQLLSASNKSRSVILSFSSWGPGILPVSHRQCAE